MGCVHARPSLTCLPWVLVPCAGNALGTVATIHTLGPAISDRSGLRFLIDQWNGALGLGV